MADKKKKNLKNFKQTKIGHLINLIRFLDQTMLKNILTKNMLIQIVFESN